MTDTREKNLQKIGKSALSSIRYMVAALECDYDRLADLRDMKDECDAGTSLTEDDADELATLESDAGDCKDQDEARERIQEDPLSIEFRTGWMTGREVVEREDWAEAKILLATGGPAVQIIVELNDGQPHRAYLQVQDWGTPWTDYYEEGIGELLMAYVNVFCFE